MSIDDFGRCECCGHHVKEEELKAVIHNGKEELWCIDCCYEYDC
jgi:hypothetical protein